MCVCLYILLSLGKPNPDHCQVGTVSTITCLSNVCLLERKKKIRGKRSKPCRDLRLCSCHVEIHCHSSYTQSSRRFSITYRCVLLSNTRLKRLLLVVTVNSGCRLSRCTSRGRVSITAEPKNHGWRVHTVRARILGRAQLLGAQYYHIVNTYMTIVIYIDRLEKKKKQFFFVVVVSSEAPYRKSVSASVRAV